MSASNSQLSLTSVQATSAQVALVLAISIYYKLFDSFALDDFYKENDQICEKKMQLFWRRLAYILDALKSEESVSEASPQTWDRIKTLPKGKLRYFNENHQLLVTENAGTELNGLLGSSSINNETDIHVLNQFMPRKSSPLSSRRIAVSASMYGMISSLLIFSVILSEDQNLLGLFMDSEWKTDLEDVSGITLTFLLSGVIVANVLQRFREDRTYALTSQYTLCSIAALNKLAKTKSNSEALPPDMNFPIIEQKHYDDVCKDGNILGFKGAISSEASKQRSRITLGTAIVFSVGFLLLDVFTGGGFLALRISIGVTAAIAIMATRYVVKTEQNKVNLYAKEKRSLITSAFQAPLIAELRVYGLQPVDSTKEISSDTVNVKRQVSVDVETFLSNKKADIEAIIKNDANKLSDTMSWIKRNIPPEYQQYPYYFLAECSFQVRQTYLDEDTHMIDAEREMLFVKPANQFFSRLQAKGIKYLHTMTHTMTDKSISPPEEQKVHQKIKCDLAWNPWISARRLAGSNQEDLKGELSWTMGYAYYSATRFSLAPWQKNEAVLDAYYTKRCQAAKKKLIEEENKDHPAVKASSSDIFASMLEEDEQKYKDKVRDFGKKSLKEKHQENMAGVGVSSILSSGATVLFLAISPALVCASHMFYVCSELISDLIFKGGEAVAYLTASSLFKTCAINYRRDKKTEAKYRLP